MCGRKKGKHNHNGPEKKLLFIHFLFNWIWIGGQHWNTTWAIIKAWWWWSVGTSRSGVKLMLRKSGGTEIFSQLLVIEWRMNEKKKIREKRTNRGERAEKKNKRIYIVRNKQHTHRSPLYGARGKCEKWKCVLFYANDLNNSMTVVCVCTRPRFTLLIPFSAALFPYRSPPPSNSSTLHVSVCIVLE